jgi:regulator of replication initiation timing
MAENSHLNTENERLRTALTAIVDSAEMEYFGAYGVEPELIDAARAALEAGK